MKIFKTHMCLPTAQNQKTICLKMLWSLWWQFWTRDCNRIVIVYWHEQEWVVCFSSDGGNFDRLLFFLWLNARKCIIFQYSMCFGSIKYSVYHCAHCLKEHLVLCRMGKTFLKKNFNRRQMVFMKRDGAPAKLFSKTNLQCASQFKKSRETD